MKTKGLLMLALAVALAVGAVASSAGAPRGGAVAAKKCKKKKKKCKEVGGKSGVLLVRATLTWTGTGGDTDYDLYVFDPNGQVGRGLANPIAQSQISNAIGAPGTETFTDLNFVKGQARNFSFGVCKQSGGHDGSIYTIDYVNASGVHFTFSHAGASAGYAAKYGPKGHAPVAPNGFAPCPAPVGG